MKAVMFAVWPGAIHEGNGKAVFIVDPATTDKQVEALSQICTGKLGGMPWEVFGPSYEVVALLKKPITIQGSGRTSTLRVEGVGEGRGEALKNPLTGEDHAVNVDLPQGFIWKKGEAGRGSFRASAAGLTAEFEAGLTAEFDGTNWIHYQFDWSNAA